LRTGVLSGTVEVWRFSNFVDGILVGIENAIRIQFCFLTGEKRLIWNDSGIPTRVLEEFFYYLLFILLHLILGIV
jgi:hypothetical protein